jgi:STE24 endopeptidase
MKIIVWGGPYFYLYLTAFSVVSIILLMMLIPNVIMPMFNKYTELQDPVLKRRIEEEAERMKFPLKHIYVMDASKRTAHSNAFYYGFGSNKRIVIFDTMLEQH